MEERGDCLDVKVVDRPLAGQLGQWNRDRDFSKLSVLRLEAVLALEHADLLIFLAYCDLPFQFLDLVYIVVEPRQLDQLLLGEVELPVGLA